MLKVYCLVSISLLISAYGNKYNLTEENGKFNSFIANDEIDNKVAVNVYNSDIDKSTYMKPDGTQMDEIAEVIDDALCSNLLVNDDSELYHSILHNISDNYKCIVTPYYIYKEYVYHLDDYINIYNLKYIKTDKITFDYEFDKIFMKILSGLNYLHDPSTRQDKLTQSVIHMDIKPENIFISNNNPDTCLEAILGNFDISVYGYNSKVHHGTPSYYDPRRADLYLSKMMVNQQISKFTSTTEEKYFNNKSEVYAVSLLMYKFCYFTEPWNTSKIDLSNIDDSEIDIDNIDFTTIPHVDIVIYDSIDHTTMPNNSDISPLLLLRYLCRKELTDNCIKYANEQKQRLYRDTVIDLDMNVFFIIKLLYAEVITSFDASSMLSRGTIDGAVNGNCNADRFDLIKQMLTYNDEDRPTAGEALEALTHIHNTQYHIISQ
eukprot:GHVR01150970.1.p1 GENE.GHVR01150970.1~~GHVR01150970.1.p1  ORF type:complete len:433 (+),score=53.47 GHVR01150970.1:32-1330(+)